MVGITVGRFARNEEEIVEESDKAEEAMAEPSYGSDSILKNAIEKMNQKKEVPIKDFSK